MNDLRLRVMLACALAAVALPTQASESAHPVSRTYAAATPTAARQTPEIGRAHV